MREHRRAAAGAGGQERVQVALGVEAGLHHRGHFRHPRGEAAGALVSGRNKRSCEHKAICVVETSYEDKDFNKRTRASSMNFALSAFLLGTFPCSQRASRHASLASLSEI